MKVIDFLQSQFPDSSKRTLKIWMKQGRLEMNGKTLRQAVMKEAEKQVVTLRKKVQTLQGLKICYEDKDLIVIEKPMGVLSVNTLREKGSGFDRLKKSYPKIKVYVIHRLDRDTKGLLVFAFNEKTFIDLKNQFATKVAKRHYLAIMNGTFQNKSGKWTHLLTELKNTFMQVTKNREQSKEAISLYEILFEKNDLSLAHIQLKTGRKNQIRVQAAYENHPIVGDQKYGNKESEKMQLHAFFLQFMHPSKDKWMYFFSKPNGNFFRFFPSLNGFLKPFMDKSFVEA